MLASSLASPLYEFGQFRLDPVAGQLLRDGKPIPMEPKVFQTLLFLVQNRGRLVQKDELMREIWPDRFVEETNLARNISILRKALGKDEDGNQYIETAARRGYRFVTAVRQIERREHGIGDVVHLQRAQNRSALITKRMGLRLATLILAGSTLLIGSAIGITRFFSSNIAEGDFPKEARAAARRAAAYEEYKNGRALWNKRTSAGQFASVSQFQQAIATDPGFALAYDGLADAYAFDRVRWREAEALARKALEIEKGLGEPHATLGFIRTFWDWEWKDGEREFRQAIELSPKYATAHQWYAIHLAITGRSVEANMEMRRAVELERDSAVMNADMGQILYFNHRFDDAIAACKRSLEIDPDFFNAHKYLYEIYCEKGLYDEAFTEMSRIAVTPGAAELPVPEGAREAFRSKGIRGFWQWRLQELSSTGPATYEAAEIHARLGEKDKALSDLEGALQNREFNIVFLTADPAFWPLVREPRYINLVARLGSLPVAP